MRLSFLVLLITVFSSALPCIANSIRIVVPYTVGGYADRIARILADGLAGSLNARTYVENVTGASGRRGAMEVSQATPDGKTLLVVSPPALIIGTITNAVTALDPLKHFTYIAYIGGPPMAIAVPASGKIRSFEDLVAVGRIEPLTSGSAGIGTLGYAIAAVTAGKQRLTLRHISYSQSMLPDLVGGHIDLAVVAVPTIAGFLRSGELRVLAVSTQERVSELLDIPTLKDVGIDLAATPWLALAGPPSMDPRIIYHLNGLVEKVLKNPALTKVWSEERISPRPMSPSDLVRLVSDERVVWHQYLGQGYR